MSFWDSSAVLPLCLNLPASSALREIQQAHGVPVVWWGALIECCSALERRLRQGQLSVRQKFEAERILDILAGIWQDVQPTGAVRDRARRLLAVHNLRAIYAPRIHSNCLPRWCGRRNAPAGARSSASTPACGRVPPAKVSRCYRPKRPKIAI